MKTNMAIAVSLAILLIAGFGMAQTQTVRAQIPFEFAAAGKVFPAGEYAFNYDPGRLFVSVQGTEKGSAALVPIVTMLAGAMHTTPKDAHVVFDKIGNKRYLSELWISGMDGIDLLTTKEKHEHEIVNVPR
jgi:hypothetical protein